MDNRDFKGYGENVATFLADKTVEVGKFVVMSDENFTVTAAGNGDEIFGFCIGKRDDYVAIQTAGYIEVPQFMSKGLKKLFGYPPYCKKCKDLLLECKDCPDKDNRQKEKMK